MSLTVQVKKATNPVLRTSVNTCENECRVRQPQRWKSYIGCKLMKNVGRDDKSTRGTTGTKTGIMANIRVVSPVLLEISKFSPIH